MVLSHLDIQPGSVEAWRLDCSRVHAGDHGAPWGGPPGPHPAPPLQPKTWGDLGLLRDARQPLGSFWLLGGAGSHGETPQKYGQRGEEAQSSTPRPSGSPETCFLPVVPEGVPSTCVHSGMEVVTPESSRAGNWEPQVMPELQ